MGSLAVIVQVKRDASLVNQLIYKRRSEPIRSWDEGAIASYAMYGPSWDSYAPRVVLKNTSTLGVGQWAL
jgi:hypothetical protein